MRLADPRCPPKATETGHGLTSWGLVEQELKILARTMPSPCLLRLKPQQASPQASHYQGSRAPGSLASSL